jgi:hypothetical protein
MPTWITVTASIVTVIVILAGALNFPYIPMFFGVHGSERASTRGKLIVKLIWLFPPVSLLCLYLAWTVNGYFSLIPFGYIAFTWGIRANKTTGAEPAREYTTKQENLKARIAELEYRWNSWAENRSTSHYILFTFFAGSTASAQALRDTLAKTENLHGEIELSTYDNGTASVYVRISLDKIDKNVITALTGRMVDVAWDNKCELLSLDVMEDME